jgi:Leucine-rich repeat (LRR) protein
MEDLTLLAPLTQLQTLETDIDSIHGVSNLFSLTQLAWANTHVTDYLLERDLVELKALPMLVSLQLELWELNHPEFVQSSSITALRFHNMHIEDAIGDGLRGVANLRDLSLSWCCWTDLSGLSALKHLEVLDVFNVNYELNASSLRGLTQLKTLYVASYHYDNPRVDLSPLREAGVELRLDVHRD